MLFCLDFVQGFDEQFFVFAFVNLRKWSWNSSSVRVRKVNLLFYNRNLWDAGTIHKDLNANSRWVTLTLNPNKQNCVKKVGIDQVLNCRITQSWDVVLKKLHIQFRIKRVQIKRDPPVETFKLHHSVPRKQVLGKTKEKGRVCLRCTHSSLVCDMSRHQ